MRIFLGIFLGLFLLAESFFIKSTSMEKVEIFSYEKGKLIWKISAKKGKLRENKFFLEGVLLEWYFSKDKISFIMDKAIYDKLNSLLTSETEITIKSAQYLLKGKGLYVNYKFKKFFLSEKAEMQIKNE